MKNKKVFVVSLLICMCVGTGISVKAAAGAGDTPSTDVVKSSGFIVAEPTLSPQSVADSKDNNGEMDIYLETAEGFTKKDLYMALLEETAEIIYSTPDGLMVEANGELVPYEPAYTETERTILEELEAVE